MQFYITIKQCLEAEFLRHLVSGRKEFMPTQKMMQLSVESLEGL